MVTENSEAFSLILNHISTKLSKAFANTLRDTEALSVRRIYDLKVRFQNLVSIKKVSKLREIKSSELLASKMDTHTSYADLTS